MFGAKRINHGVIKLHKGEPHIETTVTFLTPIDRESELFLNLSMYPNTVAKVMEGLNSDVEDIIGDTFTADVQMVHNVVVDLYGSKKAISQNN